MLNRIPADVLEEFYARKQREDGAKKKRGNKDTRDNSGEGQAENLIDV
jgi:V-type H+-transporting ATPase subunit B